MRIISGKYKGRNLKSPGNSLTVRPTTDRGKETLFNVLFNHINIEDIVVADLFCGTGGIGIEFLSRGAGFCYFVDSDIFFFGQFKDIIERLEQRGSHSSLHSGADNSVKSGQQAADHRPQGHGDAPYQRVHRHAHGAFFVGQHGCHQAHRCRQ